MIVVQVQGWINATLNNKVLLISRHNVNAGMKICRNMSWVRNNLIKTTGNNN